MKKNRRAIAENKIIKKFTIRISQYSFLSTNLSQGSFK
jgi:hypothetical protein